MDIGRQWSSWVKRMAFLECTPMLCSQMFQHIVVVSTLTWNNNLRDIRLALKFSSFFVKPFLPLCHGSSFLRFSCSAGFDIIGLQCANVRKTCSEAHDYDASDNFKQFLKWNWMKHCLWKWTAAYWHINSVLVTDIFNLCTISLSPDLALN